MRFKLGDDVIKVTGGNKMKVIECDSNGIKCAWVCESYNEETFDEKDLVPISEYKCLLNNYKRDDIIEQILK